MTPADVCLQVVLRRHLALVLLCYARRNACCSQRVQELKAGIQSITHLSAHEATALHPSGHYWRPKIERSLCGPMPDLFAGEPHNRKAQPAEECKEGTWSSEKPLQPPLRPAEVPPVRGSHMVGHLLFSASVCKQAQALSGDDASTGGHGNMPKDDRRCIRTGEVPQL